MNHLNDNPIVSRLEPLNSQALPYPSLSPENPSTGGQDSSFHTRKMRSCGTLGRKTKIPRKVNFVNFNLKLRLIPSEL